MQVHLDPTEAQQRSEQLGWILQGDIIRIKRIEKSVSEIKNEL